MNQDAAATVPEAVPQADPEAVPEAVSEAVPDWTPEELEEWCAPVQWTANQLEDRKRARELFRQAVCPQYARDFSVAPAGSLPPSVGDVVEAVAPGPEVPEVPVAPQNPETLFDCWHA
jgi:hypothetical protein